MATALIARIPGSKSLTNRALLAAAAAPGRSVLRRPLVSDDSLAFADGLRQLGYGVETREAEWLVDGLGRGPRAALATLDCHDAGTAARFLPALAAAGEGCFRFDGSAQLRRRPLRPLLDALKLLGAAIEQLGDAGQDLPFELTASGLGGGEIEVDGSQSSQYVSGLLLAAPLMREVLRLRAPALISRPYVDMTLGLMRRFGVESRIDAEGTIAVLPGSYRPITLDVEPDASTASYFFAAAALTGATLTVPALGSSSAQGDLRFVEVLARMGAQVEQGDDATTVTGPTHLTGGFAVDMNAISDTFMTLAAIAPFADRPIRIERVGHTRLKESDRIDAMADNLTRCGVTVETGDDWIEIRPARPHPAVVACHGDHRIAMSFSVLGLRAAGIELDDPACVTKTFPEFHEEIRRLFG